jgi:hypothetical protein
MLPGAELRQVLGLLALIPVPEQIQTLKIFSKNTQKFFKNLYLHFQYLFQ